MLVRVRDVLRGTLPAAGVSLGWFRTLRDGTCSRLVFSHGCGRCHICDVRPCRRLPSRPTRLRCCGIAWSESSSIGQLGPPKPQACMHSSQLWGPEAQDQSVSRLGFFRALPPWLADGRRLAVSVRGLPSVPTHIRYLSVCPDCLFL